MFRRGPRLTIRAILVTALGLSLLTVPSVTPQASAANPDCAPTTAGNINVRLYIFSNTTLCDWVIPSGWADFTIEVVGGGGGGGGGSWSGATGGGGGGGGVGDLYKRPLSQTPGTRISLVAGTGGTAGNGAASQGTAAGTNGGDGSASTVFISSSESYTALGGSGGSAGNGDVGGTGGSGFKNSQYFVTQQAPYLGARISGGSENSGNGGAGGFTGYEANATASNPGRSATSNGLLNSIQDKTAGFGGARTGTSQLANDNLKPTSRGGSSTVASAPGKSNSGSGGGGGAGCSGTLSVCNNKNGSAGGSGYILIYGNFRTVVSHPNTFSTDPSVGLRVLAVGVTPSYPTITVNNQIGSVSWSISPSLPAGITLNSSSGQLSGVPQTATAKTDYRPMATDSFGSIDTDSWTFQVNKGTGAVPTFTASNIVYNVPTALVASGGSGTGAFTFASSDPNCVLSGSRGETVTAQKASGTCSITVTKAGDSNYYSASKSATFTMVKQPSTLSIAVSPASPRQDGTQITITATVGSGQTGTVTFTAGGSAIGSCGTAGAVTISGTSAICTWTPTASGSPFTLSATYSGDANYQGSSSNSISYTIYPSISLSYPSVSTTFGSAKTSTPTISGGTGSTSSWSWSVVRTSDSSTVSGITINSSGVVSVSSSLAAATYSMRVNATDTVGVTKSVLLPVVVGLSGGAATTISASKTATTVSGSIELRATVVTGATGTIAFKFGSTTITGCGTVTITSGSAACTWTPASASGSPFTVTAVYSGDSNFSTNTSAGQVITVNPAGTFTYTSQNYVFGSERSINASISGGTGAFSTWTIVNTSDNQSDNRVSINDAGRITIATNLPVGTYTFAISASDEEAINGSGTIVITVTKSSPTVTLSARMVDGTIVTSGTLGRQVRLVVNLSTPAGGQATISGNSTTLCTVFIFNGAGECWWAPTDASASPYTISASFTGTTDANSATSNQLTNFAWNPSISISYTNRSIETGKLATISPTISGGTGARNLWSWSISQFFTGDSIGGISINNSGVISIGASVQPDTYTMVVGGADLAGAVEYANVTITIANQVAPKISLSNSSETITVNSALTGFTISNTGSDVSAFSIDGTLPAGLSFDTSTGLLAGTPSETLTVTTFIISASNFSGSDTATFTLTINSAGGGGGGSASVTISLTGGATTAAKGTPIAITATVNITGKVSFYINGKPISGCTARHTTSSVSCTWKPAIQGQSVTLSALLKPSSVNYTNARSNLLQVGVGRRTGRR